MPNQQKGHEYNIRPSDPHEIDYGAGNETEYYVWKLIYREEPAVLEVCDFEQLLLLSDFLLLPLLVLFKVNLAKIRGSSYIRKHNVLLTLRMWCNK